MLPSPILWTQAIFLKRLYLQLTSNLACCTAWYKMIWTSPFNFNPWIWFNFRSISVLHLQKLLYFIFVLVKINLHYFFTTLWFPVQWASISTATVALKPGCTLERQNGQQMHQNLRNESCKEIDSSMLTAQRKILRDICLSENRFGGIGIFANFRKAQKRHSVTTHSLGIIAFVLYHTDCKELMADCNFIIICNRRLIFLFTPGGWGNVRRITWNSSG